MRLFKKVKPGEIIKLEKGETLEWNTYQITDNDVKILEVILENMRGNDLSEDTDKILNKFLKYHTEKMAMGFANDANEAPGDK